VRYDRHSDRTLRLHDSERLEPELEQYFPFSNKRRAIALRGFRHEGFQV